MGQLRKKCAKLSEEFDGISNFLPSQEGFWEYGKNLKKTGKNGQNGAAKVGCPTLTAILGFLFLR